MSCWIDAHAIDRDVARIATDDPVLWREIRRFNLPVKLALAAAQRVSGSLVRPSHTRLVALAPCRPGSPELRAISRDADAGLARGACGQLRVNPIYTLHAIDNLALSALAIRLENREPAVCFGGAAGQAFVALEYAMDELAASGGSGVIEAAGDVLIVGGDQGEASLRGEPGDAEACGVAIVLSTRPHRVRLVAIERTPIGDLGRAAGEPPAPHAVRGIARWLDALADAPAGTHRHRVPTRDGDGIDQLAIVVEVA